MNNELLVKAGIIAVNKWNIDIDPIEITVKFVDTLDPFVIEAPSVLEFEDPPKEWIKEPECDIIEFEPYSDTHFGYDNEQVLLAWGPKSKTLVICYYAFDFVG